MNNGINPYAALPMYERLESQMAFRHSGPVLRCPQNRLPSWQVRVDKYRPTPKTFLVSADGMAIKQISYRGFDTHDPEDGTFIYTYRGDPVLNPFDCGIYYFQARIDDLVLFSERFEIYPLGTGDWIDIALEVDTDLTFTATTNALISPESSTWEYFVDGLGWEDIVLDGDPNQITVDPSLFWQAQPQDMVVRIRRISSYEGHTVEAYYSLVLREQVEASELIRVPPPNPITQNSDYYELEFWHGSDAFGFLYSQGFKQRMYVHATFDGVEGDEVDVFDTKPTGLSERRSAVYKARNRLVIDSLPDHALASLEGACRHKEIRVKRLSDGVTMRALEAQFDPGSSNDPLSTGGTFSFVQDIFYRAGATTIIPVQVNDPERIDFGEIDGP